MVKTTVEGQGQTLGTRIGSHLLLDSDDPRYKTQSIFGAPDEIIEQKLPPDLLKDLFGKNREMFVICVNVTTIVTITLMNSASPTHVRVVSMGSYTRSCTRW